jgi:hypothetical protein
MGESRRADNFPAVPLFSEIGSLFGRFFSLFGRLGNWQASY